MSAAIFVLLDDADATARHPTSRLYTGFVREHPPPVADGILPGVMRGVLLDHAAWRPAECRLGRGDVMRAEAIVVCNAMRGAMRASLHAVAPTRV
jgi:hypothetical protein